MAKERIAIVGLGQIGGSVVLSLRRRNINCRITGIDTSRKRLRLLRSRLDVASSSWEAAEDQDFILLALHFNDTIRFLSGASRETTILDTCSAKVQVLTAANKRKLRFLGGHPLAGNEFAGEKGWREDLFEDKPFFLCPGKSAASKDLRAAKQWIRALGARPVATDPLLHDRMLAATSHFPAILSLLLQQTTKNAPLQFQGPGYRSMTRLAHTPPELIETFLQSNGGNILKTAAQFQRALQKWIKATTKAPSHEDHKI